MREPLDQRSFNPRCQCIVCGKWKRQFNRKGERIMVAASGENWEQLDRATGYVGDVCKEEWPELNQTHVIHA